MVVLNISKNVAGLENCLPEIQRISYFEVGFEHQDFVEVLEVIPNMQQHIQEEILRRKYFSLPACGEAVGLTRRHTRFPQTVRIEQLVFGAHV